MPAKPDLKTGVDVSLLITDLVEWGKDCESKLSKTWQSIDQAQADADKLNQKPQQ